MNNDKYKLLKEESSYRTVGKVYRIEALRDFGDVKKGDKGGFVSGYDNLSHEGNCWIYDDAMVFKNAKVLDDAKVLNMAWVYGDAIIKDSATVSGNVDIAGSTVIGNDVVMTGASRTNEGTYMTNSVEIRLQYKDGLVAKYRGTIPKLVEHFETIQYIYSYFPNQYTTLDKLLVALDNANQALDFNIESIQGNYKKPIREED